MNAEPAILVVDDDPITRLISVEALKDGGFPVIEATDGAEACQMVIHQRPKLLIVDLVMPRMDGFELCRELRRHSASAAIPILVVSGLNDLDSVAQAYNAGATDFISKPVHGLMLQHRVRYMLRATQAFAEVQNTNASLEEAAAQLRAANESLECRVVDRTRGLQQANERLHRKHRQLQAAKQAADDANRGKTEFLTNMNHELRTPLNAIIGFSSIICERIYGPVADKYVDAAKMIGEGGEHLLHLINTMLDLAQAEANRLVLHEEEFDLSETLGFVGKIIGEMARKNEISFRVEHDQDLPILFADQMKLRQILINILANAIKFTASGGSVRLEVECHDRGDMIFRIEDTGIGIPKDKIPFVFMPFAQINSSVGRRHNGSGLGLPLALQLTRLHSGTLKVSSQLGRGTVVTISMPRERCRLQRPAGSLAKQNWLPSARLVASSAN